MGQEEIPAWITQAINVVTEQGIQIGLKLLGGIILWMVGRKLIALASKLIQRGFDAKKVDATVTRYLTGSLSVILTVALIAAILGFFGVETTSFAALLAGAGIAIGTAWGGLLKNFASGAFIMVLRPFKVGDFITAGGVTGTVKEIGMFVTIIDTMDNVKTIIGNDNIFSGTIQNFTANPYRRVDLVAQLSHGADHARAIEILKAALLRVDGVSSDPSPTVEILEFNLAGPVLAVRPYCHNDVYWDVYFKTNETIRHELGAAGFTVPEKHFNITSVAA